MVQGGGTRVLVMCKATQHNSFFVSLPFQDNHNTSSSQSTQPLSLILFQWILAAVLGQRRHYYSCFTDEQPRQKEAPMITYLVTAKLGHQPIFLRPDPGLSTMPHCLPMELFKILLIFYYPITIWKIQIITHAGTETKNFILYLILSSTHLPCWLQLGFQSWLMYTEEYSPEAFSKMDTLFNFVNRPTTQEHRAEGKPWPWAISSLIPELDLIAYYDTTLVPSVRRQNHCFH